MRLPSGICSIPHLAPRTKLFNIFPRKTTSDSDFFSTLVSCLMQLLGLYTSAVPLFRHTALRNAYAYWAWLLKFGSFALNVVAPGAYLATPLVPLIAFTGNALQAFAVLQLLWVIDVGMKSPTKHEKEA
ncbi:hypothetical protein EJ06DRAFT_527564 [Trichodelitschia bisporula]|uniref:Uncharacterized protein n=1 Tax=Trichodelitschia bisporula TaxID=703511 RepID=A0A6G1I6U4_9PEZI|nr:hypothetical protein EJ06DRAFT_527564 [Trichodelitschia bisporula]